MRWLRTLLLVPALLTLVAGGAAAQAAPPAQRGPDPSFAGGGIATIAVPRSDDSVEGFTVAADGRIYVLDGRQLLAIESDGALAGDFGEGGRVTVAPAIGEVEPEGGPSALAVDSQGRLLMAGSSFLKSQRAYEAYVIRLLPDGSRDPTFGDGGEVDTYFGLPDPLGEEALSVEAASIFVDAEDRPVLGGAFSSNGDVPCGYDFKKGPDPFVARLTTTGAIDETFATSGHELLRGPGGVDSVAPYPAGGIAVFSRPCSFGARVEEQAPLYGRLDGNGHANPHVKERSLDFTYGSPLIDPKGRLVEIESVPPAAEGPDALARYHPNGRLDRGFGDKGRVILGRKLGRGADALAVDAQDRPIVAAEAGRIELRRFRANGKLDRRFGPGGRLTAKAEAPGAIALDAQGRIYTLSLSLGPSATTLRIARFIPER